jgi:hypothetical protein
MEMFRLNWFLFLLAIELWGSAVLVAFGPEIWAHWRARVAWRRAARAQADARRQTLGRLA